MVQRLRWVPVFLPFVLVPALSAETVYTFYHGNLRSDATITDCGYGCTLAPTDDDATWAQWAAAPYSFNVPALSSMYAVTFGYGGGASGAGATVVAGGLEPYLSLFDSAGNFIASTFDGTLCPAGANTYNGACYDVLLNGGTLPAGNYEIVLTAWENMSYAENLGAGTLSDGFTGLGILADGENLDYAFDLVLTSNPAGPPSGVPEPGSLPLAGTGVALLLARRHLRGFVRTRQIPTKL